MKKIYLLAQIVAICMITLSFGQDENASEITTTAASTTTTSTQSVQVIAQSQQRLTIIGAIKNFKINILHAVAYKINRIPSIF